VNKTIALMLALVVVIAAGAFATGSSGAAHRRYTIAFGADPKDSRVTGARAAAKQLGVRFVLSNCLAQGGCDQYDAKRLIARHVDAVVGAGYVPTLRPFFRKVREAGILLISSGDDIAAKRDLWVNYSGTVAFAHALADALASQINGSGEYAILEEHGQYPIATTWAKGVAAYTPQAYPNMTLDGVLNLTGGGDQAEVDAVKSFMSAHPNLKGLIGIAPTEAYMAAEAITQEGKIGQVFSASNGGDYLGPELAGYIRSGAMEDVMGGDPAKLGYLTVWAAHRLLNGRHFRPGAYQVGGPIGTVHYYKHNKELRLGQPLTITKANVDVRRTVGDPR